MINKINKNEVRGKRQLRVRGTLSGTASKPRLNIYRSTSHIYAQLVDDVLGRTLASSSTLSKSIKTTGKTKTASATIVGNDIAKKAIKLGISEAVFDRAGYLYTGRVKAVAEGAREGGLKF